MQRRQFLSSGAAAALAAQRIRGANDRIAVGLIGCGGRGRYVAGLMREAPGVEYGAVADVYLPNAERAKEWAGPQAQAYQDFRRLLEREANAPLWRDLLPVYRRLEARGEIRGGRFVAGMAGEQFAEMTAPESAPGSAALRVHAGDPSPACGLPSPSSLVLRY